MVVFFPHSNEGPQHHYHAQNEIDSTATITYVKDRSTIVGGIKIETQTRFSTSLPSPMEERLKLLPEMNVCQNFCSINFYLKQQNNKTTKQQNKKQKNKKTKNKKQKTKNKKQKTKNKGNGEIAYKKRKLCINTSFG
jgi:hypothetical protein